MIKHLSLWRLRAGSPEDKAAIVAELRIQFQALPAMIPGLVTIELGLNLQQGPDQADCALQAVFENRAALERYIAHPAHAALAPRLNEVRLERRIVDYEA